MAKQAINVEHISAELSKLLERAAGGDEVVFVRDGRPVARIVAADTTGDAAAGRPARRAGSAAGKVWISEDFDETPDEFAERT